MTLTSQLRDRAEPVWTAQLSHPFVTGIADGTLPLDAFRFYLQQDYLYLIDYSRLFAICAAKAPDLATMRAFGQLLADTLGTEMDLHRSYCAGFGIDVAVMDQIEKAPTCQAYTDFLIATALNGDVLDALAALLPCAWGYRDVGHAIVGRGVAEDNPFHAWIDMYAGEDYSAFVDWCREITDQLSDGLPDWRVDQLARIFRTSTRYEAAFWEMAWTIERW